MKVAETPILPNGVEIPIAAAHAVGRTICIAHELSLGFQNQHRSDDRLPIASATAKSGRAVQKWTQAEKNVLVNTTAGPVVNYLREFNVKTFGRRV